jgi:phage shock protein E
MKSFIFILAFSIITLHNVSAQIPDSLKFKAVQPEEFLTKIKNDKNGLLIDVREKFEFRKGHLQNAKNLPVSKGYKKIINTTDKNIPILLYCKSDPRSRKVAIKLYDAGFRNLYLLKGGINNWSRKGFPTEKRRHRNNSEKG